MDDQRSSRRYERERTRGVLMNPDKCIGCHQHCDPFDPEYCVWQGHRWHVSCALKQANDDIETMREKQGRYDTTAANYSALQAKIDNLMDEREGLLKILREVPEQSQQLGKLFMEKSPKFRTRDDNGKLLEGEIDSSRILGDPDAVHDRIGRHKYYLTEGGNEI